MKDKPEVSVIIPTRNAGVHFSRLLEAVFGQVTDKSYEVLALDSGSTDGTLDLLERYPVRLIEIDPSSFDWGRLRERAFEESRGAVFVNISQDAIPAGTDWLDNLIRPLEDERVGASCGGSIPDPERDFPQFQWEKNGYYYFTLEIKKFVSLYGKGLSFGNAAVPRKVWEELHIEPQATGEDFQFQMKLHGAGYRIEFPKDAPALHHHNYTLPAVFKRSRNEGFGLRQMGVKYNEFDLVRDFLGPRKYVQWLREVKRGTLGSPAEWLYPFMRPFAVYWGSRFARRYKWY